MSDTGPWNEWDDDETVIQDHQNALVSVRARTRLSGMAYHGAHVYPGGLLIASGGIGERLTIDAGGICHVSGYMGASLAPSSVVSSP